MSNDKPVIEPKRLHADLKHELTVLLSEEDFVAQLASGDSAERARRLSEALRSALYVIDLHRSDRAEIERLRAREALLERALLNVGDVIDVRECPYSYGHECVEGICTDPGPDCDPSEHKIHRCWLEYRVRQAAAQLAAEEEKADAS